jgi:hypothetical protein
VDSLARVGQAQREQVAGLQLAGQAHRHVAEVELRLAARQVGLRHECLCRGFARSCEDLRLPVRDVASHHRVGHLGAVVLDEPVEDPGDRMALLARRIEVRPQHLVDHRLLRIQCRRPGSGPTSVVPGLTRPSSHQTAPPDLLVPRVRRPDSLTAAPAPQKLSQNPRSDNRYRPHCEARESGTVRLPDG